MQYAIAEGAKDKMSKREKGQSARHVIVVAGASGSGKTHLINKLSQPPHDVFTLKVLKSLACDPNQRIKRSTVERMQRLMDPANFKKGKTRKLKHILLIHIDFTSINHNNNLNLLRQISKQTRRLDVITLYTSPKEWRQRILDRISTEDEPSMRAALIALLAKASTRISNFLYHREYKIWLEETKNYRINRSCIINTFEESFLTSIPPEPKAHHRSR